MISSKIHEQLIKQRGKQQANHYQNYQLNSLQPLVETAQEVLSVVKPSFGACAMLSAAWAGMLNKKYNIPAIVVAGDLDIHEHKIFNCSENIPVQKDASVTHNSLWDGHCWIEIDGYIGDISLFRTAYTLQESSILRQFVECEFGGGRGGILSKQEDLPNAMKYIPKYVLSNEQVEGLVAGLGYQLRISRD
ncbi:hypothetical protein DC915_RS03275 [Vibrio parahaemolyticus]|uniref:Uncharacterized protein n=2 Tax=Vibrio harveyi group TaxID=717610 RepID=A0A9Q3U9S0_VIBPH|nr:hypothetical protein [Vibrio parahaemolyticus]ELA8176471.1 hypothetical protein [Vibrio alginolyticus]CAH1592719.1 conserved hypothetical protein [Vibrio jasicida]EJC7176266.1 hypothetical protein [Vibrio parahaemolyticus]EJE4724715.1 hypothetical protein [Vibrio parahaemolyticus]EJG0010001.1 hypothetical protein [Vibrio parahaemolyticus]